jgi:hypothetical protein
VAIARRLATTQPLAKLPCPVCGESVGARNLDPHLAKVHDVTEWFSATGPSDAPWTGGDRRVLRWLYGLTAASMFGSMATIAVTPHPQGSISLLGATLCLAVCIGSVMLAWFDKFRARLVFRGEALELRYALGLLRHSVRLPARVETGEAYEVHEGPPAYGGGMGGDVAVGIYLRLTDYSLATLTIRCAQDCALEEHWDPRGLGLAQRSKHWDITLDRASFAGLEYSLADRDMMSLRTR